MTRLNRCISGALRRDFHRKSGRGRCVIGGRRNPEHPTPLQAVVREHRDNDWEIFNTYPICVSGCVVEGGLRRYEHPVPYPTSYVPCDRNIRDHRN
jgi:hypothetical protein